MKIDRKIKAIYETGKVSDDQAIEYDVQKTSISREEGEFIRNIVASNDIQRTIEVGCAYGLSSLFICAGLQNKPARQHTIIDPFQSSQWKNIGVSNLKQAGVDYFDLIEEYSEIALPKLLSEQKTYDFGFIDGWHTFDHTLIDFFYLNRMLRVGGIVIIDDVLYPSINKLMGYISQYPCYEVIGTIDVASPRRTVEKILTLPLQLISLLLPFAVSSRIFAGRIALTNKKFKLNTSMIALKKIKEDERSYDWFRQF